MNASNTENQSHHLVWPAERFYWALLDDSIIGGSPGQRRVRHEQVGYLFETVLPVPIESLHFVWKRLGNNQIVACGSERAALPEITANGVVSITPASIPAHISAVGLEPTDLNLAVGEFEPRVITRLRTRIGTLAACAAVAILTILFMGFMRRAGQYEQNARTWEDAQHALANSIVSVSPSQPGHQTLPPRLRLQTELRRLQMMQSADRLAIETETPDAQRQSAVRALETLLVHWPASINIETQSIIITPTTISVIAVTRTMQDAGGIADALSGMEGWNTDQPEIVPHRQGVRVRVRAVLQPPREVNERGGIDA